MKMKCICILADAITSFYVVHEIPFSILHIVSYLFVPRNMASKFTYLLYWLTVLVIYLSNIFTFSSYTFARIALQLLLF
jgi:hypothetical protein